MASDQELISKAVEQLGEHFDTVHIFVTRHEPEIENGTVQVNDGAGNWYARYGHVREWIVRQEERMCKSVKIE